MNPASLAQLLEADRLGDFQAAIVAGIKSLITGISVQAHPGKVDVAELIARSTVKAPGVSIGWSRMRASAYMHGGYTLMVEWVAYIVVEALAIDDRRTEAQAVAFAIGSRLLEILDDNEAPFWGLDKILAPEQSPPAELKPIFTVKDARTGTTYYAVTWTQGIVDLGGSRFPGDLGEADPENGTINYESEEAIDRIKRFLPGLEVDDGEE